ADGAAGAPVRRAGPAASGRRHRGGARGHRSGARGPPGRVSALRGRDRIEVKTPEQLALMRQAGLVVAGALRLLQEAVAPGVTTGDLDRLAEDYIRGHGATPSFLGYPYTGENDF